MFSWIPEGHVAVMEFMGKYSDIKEAGPYFYIPGFYTAKYVYNWGNVANKDHYLIEKSEQQTNTPTRYCQTKDNVTLKANTSIGWKITDVKKAVYATDHLPTMISDLALNSLRANIGTLSLNEVFASRSFLNSKINSELAETVTKWGIELLRVEIQELTYTEDVTKAMMKEMIADREKKAKISIAEGDAEAALTKARAEAEALEIEANACANAKVIRANADAKSLSLRAAAEKEYLHALKEEISTEQAASILEADKNRKSLERITENPAHKVFLPPQAGATIHI